MSAKRRWGRMIRALRECQNSLRQQLAQAIASHDLNENQFLLLEHCALQPDEEPLDQRALSQELGQSPALTSQTVDTLRKRQMLMLDRDPSDRRRQIVRLSPAGRSVLTQVCLRTDDLAQILFAQQQTRRDSSQSPREAARPDHSVVTKLLEALEQLTARCQQVRESEKSEGKAA